MDNSLKRSIVIPCFNEKGNLEKLIDTCLENLCTESIEVILTDNGSNDGSEKILSSLEKNDFLKSIRINKNVNSIF
jgi:glycosyltransferase involved in cell wall biosynthesis